MQGNSVVRGIISKCVTCRHLRGKVGEQFMADLPRRTSIQLLWGGHVWSISHKGTPKYFEALWSTIYLLMVSRAAHIESMESMSMETDSFTLALRRFIARRGNVMLVQRELAKSMEEMNHCKIQRFMLNKNADWIVVESCIGSPN